MKVIILAAGKSTRFGSNKHFIPIGDETLIRRMCRQVKERGRIPVVVTRNKNIERHCKDYEIFHPKFYSTQMHTLFFSSSIWDDSEIIVTLSGDAIYTDKDMDSIFKEKNLKVLVSAKEVGGKALSFVIPSKSYDMVREEMKKILIEGPEDKRLARRLYRELRKKVKNIEIPTDGISRDIDTQEELDLFNKEVILNNKL